MIPRSLTWVAALLACAALSAPVSLIVQRLQTERTARDHARALTGGDPVAGRAAMSRYGCGSCHEIPHGSGAQGKGGPSLSGLARRPEIAGVLPNDPDALVRWVRFPQTVRPGVAMPDLGVTATDGRDIAAYIYTLR